MKVILLQDVPAIGTAGTIKDVKQGYGFNYLLPRGLATLATETALRETKKRLDKTEAKRAEIRAEFEKKAAQLSGKTFIMKEQAKDGKLFGSVGKKEIAEMLAKENIAVEASEITLKKSLKETGVFELSAMIGQQVKTDFTLDIQAE